MRKICNCKTGKKIKNIEFSDIVYNETGTSMTNSFFYFGTSYENKTLNVKLSSTHSFCKGTIFKLKLVGYKDQSRIVTKINPVKAYNKLKHNSKSVEFNLIDKDIPIPSGIIVMDTINDLCDNPNCQPRVHAGITIEYCFILTVICPCLSVCSFPLNIRYISFDCLVDVKCEKPSISDTQDVDHPIKVICKCGDTTKIVYSSTIHCVTHAQAPRPRLFYYIV